MRVSAGLERCSSKTTAADSNVEELCVLLEPDACAHLKIFVFYLELNKALGGS